MRLFLHRIKNEELDIYEILREYVVYLDKNMIKSKTIRNWFSCVKNYLTFLVAEIYAEKCRQKIKLPKNVRYETSAYQIQSFTQNTRICRSTRPRDYTESR